MNRKPVSTSIGAIFVVMGWAGAQTPAQFEVASVKITRDGGDKWNIAPPPRWQVCRGRHQRTSADPECFWYHTPPAIRRACLDRTGPL
jgi:hypothetical protein